MDVGGSSVLVTGASSGIGEATALACANAGAAVALAARREDRITELAKRIEDEGGRAVALPTDVTDGARPGRSSNTPTSTWADSMAWSTTPG